MKYVAFDLEIAKAIPDGISDIKQYFPLGISCAALAFSDQEEVMLWQGVPQVSIDKCQEIVSTLRKVVDDGYTLLTWNGCSFDFHVLAQESSLLDECGNLALSHVDLMLMATFTKGYFLGLDKALAGAGVKGKVKNVVLSDGTALNDMDGAKAPHLWANGEYQAVLEYLRADVTQLIELAKVIENKKTFKWKSNSGRAQSFRVENLLAVKECFKNIPQPDVSWMDNPPSRTHFVEWIPNWSHIIFNKIRFKSTYIEPYPTIIQDVNFHRREIESLFGFIDDEEGANDDSFFAELILENGNTKDANAVRVEIENYHIGYLSPSASKKYRKKLESLGISDAIGVCHASIRGGYRKGRRIDFAARLDMSIDSLEIDTSVKP